MEAHLPDPGRLNELLVPGRRIWLAPARSQARRTRWTAVLTEAPQGGDLVSIDATLPNRLVARALEEGALDELGPYTEVRSEPRVGSHRFDFLLRRDTSAAGGTEPGPHDLLLEVKSVTLVEHGVALFPDAVTARGTRHVRRLGELAREGRRCAVLFVLQRSDAHRVRAADTIDPAFAEALDDAAADGVRVLARRCRVTRKGVRLAEPVPTDVGPAPGADPAKASVPDHHRGHGTPPLAVEF